MRCTLRVPGVPLGLEVRKLKVGMWAFLQRYSCHNQVLITVFYSCFSSHAALKPNRRYNFQEKGGIPRNTPYGPFRRREPVLGLPEEGGGQPNCSLVSSHVRIPAPCQISALQLKCLNLIPPGAHLPSEVCHNLSSGLAIDNKRSDKQNGELHSKYTCFAPSSPGFDSRCPHPEENCGC